MKDVSYGISANIGPVEFEEALTKVTAALKTEGFGVLTEIDVKSTLKNKLDLEFRKYRILGACNPPLAARALQAEVMIGLLLPCNVIVFEEDDKTVTVSALNPGEIFKMVDKPGMKEMAAQVEERLRKVINSL